MSSTGSIPWSDVILHHLADIGSGQCRIDDQVIASEPNPERRQILVGLLILHEDLDYERIQRKSAEQATAIANAERERLLVELQEAVQARDHFLAIASHELRTPITTLSLQTECIESLIEDTTPMTESTVAELRARRVPFLRRQVDRLNVLISQMLDVSRLTSGHLDLEPTKMDLSLLVSEVVERVGPELTRRNIEMNLDLRDSVEGCWDVQRLDQVVTNLLSNAIKYGEARPINVSVWREGSHAFVEVRDRGIGIAVSEQEKIFAPFARAVSTRQFAGLGLGLWIARQIVAASGGSIQVKSSPEAGSTFTVELPITK